MPDSYSGNAVIGEGYASVLDEEAVLKSHLKYQQPEHMMWQLR